MIKSRTALCLSARFPSYALSLAPVKSPCLDNRFQQEIAGFLKFSVKQKKDFVFCN